MNYDIFDEKYYLAQYPWLKPAIDAGTIKSGKEHFEKFGQAGGLTKVSRYFDEATYLAGNPDIAALVRTPSKPNGTFATGLDHFIQFGYEEGRSRVSPEYDEAFYLANNRDLRPFIQNGTFKNGYQHFIKFGIKDGRFGTSFLEPEYLQKNSDIVPLVNSGALKTGREHYFNFGKNEPSRSATFVGSSGSDILTGSGVGKVELIGVEVGLGTGNGFGSGRVYESDGSSEFDILIGGSGRDKFALAQENITSRGTPLGSTQFYIGRGFATIRNFTQGQDTIELGGAISQSNSYLDIFSVFPINNGRDLAIQTKGFANPINGVPSISNSDTIAIIEGGGNLTLNQLSSFGSYTFTIG
ncbi:calcium-binding protein [Tychonema sp. BBK16]|uniref:calcium-binding protein n=1 Tax=Tychonema sp. BBK16 TaxID=2699888 RepID=UPI001F34E49E|nr:calcium-binding protein [Tychonema sp. BBK16]MCF6371981.1 calcium-binding protein [Tychonema sp. BBK16]